MKRTSRQAFAVQRRDRHGRTWFTATQQTGSQTIRLGELEIERDGENWYIEQIFVEPESRRSGVATALYEAAVAAAAREGAMLVSTSRVSPESQGFWAKQVARGRVELLGGPPEHPAAWLGVKPGVTAMSNNAAVKRTRRNPSPLDNPAFRRWFGDSRVVDERGEPLVVYHGSNAHAYSPGERIEVFGTSSRGGAFFSSDPRIASQYGERVYAVYLRLENPLVLDAAGRGWTDLRGSSRIDGRITAPVRAALRAAQQRQRQVAEREAELLDDLFAELADLEPEEPSLERGPNRSGIDPDAPSLSGHTLSDLLRIEPDDALETDDVAKAARALGFDGVIFRNVQDSPARGAGYLRALSSVYAAFSPTQIKSATDNVGTYDPSDPSILKNRRSSRRPKRTSRRSR